MPMYFPGYESIKLINASFKGSLKLKRVSFLMGTEHFKISDYCAFILPTYFYQNNPLYII